MRKITPPRYDDVYFNAMAKMDNDMKTTLGNDYKLVCGDCLDVMAEMADNTIDLTVTSPPYDNLRDYGKDFDAAVFDWHPIIKELYRVTAVGGVVVWVVADATINGSETGTSFRQALWAMEYGFRLHDTMIYKRQNPQPLNHNRYEQGFEYMFIFSKGKPKSFNPLKKPSKMAGKKRTGTMRNSGGDMLVKKHTGGRYSPTSMRDNVFVYAIGTEVHNAGGKHPAIFPEALANDHIISWSNPGDLVFDPFLGSGTTGKMAIHNGRKFIGCDIEADYVDIARQRIENEVTAVCNRGDDFTTTKTEKANGQIALWDMT